MLNPEKHTTSGTWLVRFGTSAQRLSRRTTRDQINMINSVWGGIAPITLKTPSDPQNLVHWAAMENELEPQFVVDPRAGPTMAHHPRTVFIGAHRAAGPNPDCLAEPPRPNRCPVALVGARTKEARE